MFQKFFPLLISCMICAFIMVSNASGNDNAAARYPGHSAPGDEPMLFAPGIISDGLNNRDIAMLPDGSEFYYSVNIRNFDLSTIMRVSATPDGWDGPRVAPFANNRSFKYLEPAISPDGTRFFFVASARDGHNNNDIWVMDRKPGGWGEPRKLGDTINTPVSETFPSITNDGTLYFSRASEDPGIEHIYRSRWVDGQYAAAEKLPDNVNCGKTQFNAFVAPDESYLIVSVWGREDSLGSVDYYIVFRNKADEWSEPINLGDRVNTKSGQEYSPFVSRDGRYFFFMSTRVPRAGDENTEPYSLDSLTKVLNAPENGNSDIYWMDAGFIERLRPEGF